MPEYRLKQTILNAIELSAMFKVTSSPSKRLADNKLHPSSLLGHSCLPSLSIFEGPCLLELKN